MISADQVFPKVAQSHPVYLAFVAQNKIATTSPVVLTRPRSNVEYRGRTTVEMGWASFDCDFVATRSPKPFMKYGLKLFAYAFDEKPCFRFCSRGQTHTNPETGQGLAARPVPTPHFHKVDISGIIWAYQTPELVDPVESDRIMNDPQVGMNHFCREVNFFSAIGEPVLLEIVREGLFALSELSTSDPLSGATFPSE